MTLSIVAGQFAGNGGMAEWLMADAREASVLQAMDGSETVGNSATVPLKQLLLNAYQYSVWLGMLLFHTSTLSSTVLSGRELKGGIDLVACIALLKFAIHLQRSPLSPFSHTRKLLLNRVPSCFAR
jgi:hypothetical protein